MPEYSKFVHIVHSTLQEVKEKEFGAIGIKMKGIKPLPVFKQIMTLFCDINEGNESLEACTSAIYKWLIGLYRIRE